MDAGAGTPWWIRGLRIAFAVLSVVALVWIPVRNIGVSSFSLTNYLSYFTIQSNIVGMVVLLVGGLRDPVDRRWQVVRGAATLYLLITGIIYAVLLSNIDVMLTDKWINVVHHRLIPIVMVADWLLVGSGLTLTARLIGGWLLYPLAYGVYTLLRGPHAHWYPYPFMDPHHQGGYPKLFLGLAVMAVVFAALAVVVAAATGLVPRLLGRSQKAFARKLAEVRARES
ncbi:Pr6Pr family membrane protein [Nocardia sp. NPDC051030]|uniref:Pr6Pr family membrane protein n=1 Tax=Nocardia sp. NPDC051030 TaxID=3155162 RepID=UPI00343EA47D